MVIFGTEGGKVVYYCLESFAVKWEKVEHAESVLSVALSNNMAASASSDSDLCKSFTFVNS